jgi:hypothetical protein
MSSYKDPDLQQRQSDVAAAKKATLEKFRAAADDPAVAMRHATRVAMNEARLVRIAKREAAKRTREAELAEQATRAAELEALAAAEKAEREALVAAEQKVARDARYAARKAAKKERYAARKAAKKERRRGY